jgi:hypothetical protein
LIQRLATYLSKYPSLKRGAKFSYQVLNYLMHFHTAKARSRFRVERITTDQGGFFGYYDKSPESADGRYVLYHEPARQYRPGDPMRIMVYDRLNGSRHQAGETRAWNLQAGARLQWTGTGQFMFNLYDESAESYRSALHRLPDHSVRVFDEPVYDVSGTDFLSLDFRNLHMCGSEYGYTAHHAVGPPVPAQIRSGDAGSGTFRSHIAEDDLNPLLPEAFIQTYNRHFNHIMFNPAGSVFVFIFRWNGPKGRRDALILCDSHTGNLKLLNAGMNSHFCWTSDKTLFGYCSVKGTRGFYHLDTESAIFREVSVSGLDGDGHPTSRHGLLLLDSYPDAARMQHIMLLHGNELLHAGSFYAPLVYNEYYRCDLHPRFSPDGSRVYFDSRHEGSRHLYCMHLKENDHA